MKLPWTKTTKKPANTSRQEDRELDDAQKRLGIIRSHLEALKIEAEVRGLPAHGKRGG